MINKENISCNKLIVNLSNVLFKSTGISNYTKNVFPYLKSIAPILLSSEIHAGFESYLIPDNLTSEQGTKGHFNRLIWTQFQLPRIYRKLKSKLLFSPIPEAPLFSDCFSVVMVHDFIPLRFPKRFSPLTPYHLYYVPQVLNQSEHIICNSQSTAEDIVKFCHIPSNKILISAFANVPSHLECQLWLAGSSDNRYTPRLKEQIQELGLTNQVKFLDYVPYDDLPKIISGAIALVFPSLWEGFGLPVLEAMACGTPVITSNLSSLPEVAGDAVILIDPYKVNEITDAMQAIANDLGLRSQLSELGLARAKQFSWEKTGQATVEVLMRFM